MTKVFVNAADSYCDGYKAFLDKAKTEREAAKAAMEGKGGGLYRV